MNVNRLSALVPTSFKAYAVDEAGELVEGEVKVWVNRLSFREVGQEEFQQALEGADKDPEKLGELLVKAIGKWELFSDDEGTEMLPITVESVIDRPFDFTMAMADSVFKVLFPNQQRATNSPSGSELVEKLASAATTSSTGGPSTKQLES